MRSNRTDRALLALQNNDVQPTKIVTNLFGDIVRIEFTNNNRRLVVRPYKGVYVYNPKSKSGLTKHSGSGNAWYVGSERALAREIRYIVHA